ncbi:hypothetical protein ElyMa_006476200 [Elysia marginata]|uniref:Uncharacterized protein n=1 Tax=Elysia marginata TaxID=1093978 RepID=A0AAV4I184_9GAST|nr:hypothetical protein ElyMa_006476200 [Elysia marginata]
MGKTGGESEGLWEGRQNQPKSSETQVDLDQGCWGLKEQSHRRGNRCRDKIIRKRKCDREMGGGRGRNSGQTQKALQAEKRAGENSHTQTNQKREEKIKTHRETEKVIIARNS